MTDRYLDTASLAQHLAMSEEALEQYRKRDSGPPYVRIGRCVRYRLADVEEWLQSRTVRPTKGG